MGVLRVTLDSWQDMAQLDPTPPGGAPGDAVPFRVVCSPSLTGGAVLDSLGAGHEVTHIGRVWESTVAGERSNTWAPGAYGWKDLGPA